LLTTDPITHTHTPHSPISVPADLSAEITPSASDPISLTSPTAAPPLLPSNTSAFDFSPSSPLPSAITAPDSPIPNSPSPPSEAPPCPSNDQPPLLTIQPPLPISSTHPMTTRTRTGSLRPKSFVDYKLFYTTKHPPVSLPAAPLESEPSSYTKTVADARWRAAMTQEYDALISNGTWTLCPRPSNQHVIRNKWVYRIKQKPDGSIERFQSSIGSQGV